MSFEKAPARDHFAVTNDLMALGIQPLYLVRMLTAAMGVGTAERILADAREALRPLTTEEAERAFDAAIPAPFSEAQIERILARVGEQGVETGESKPCPS